MTGRQRITVKVLDEIPYEQISSLDSCELAKYFNELYRKELLILKNEQKES